MMAFSVKTDIIRMYLDSTITFSLASYLNRANCVAINGLLEVSEIAVDWVTENIYFTDGRYNRIGICNNNDTTCTILLNKFNGIDKSTGITLLPSYGKMYWGDVDLNPYVAVAGMDGKYNHVLVSNNIEWSSSVTIDLPNNRLYWVDAKLNIIESIHMDGIDRRLVLHDLIQDPFSVAIFENMLYWSDWGSNTIQSCNKFSGKDWCILHRTYNGIHDKPYIYRHIYRSLSDRTQYRQSM